MRSLTWKKLLPLTAAGLALTFFAAPAARAEEAHERGGHEFGAMRAERHEEMGRGDFDRGYGFHEGGPAFAYSYYWDSPWWGWGPYTYGPYGYRGGAVVQMIPAGMVPVQLGVHPRRAMVSVDGKAVGEVRDFNYLHPLLLKKGEHVVGFSVPGYQTLRLEVDAENVGNTMLDYHLMRGNGPDPRSDVARSAFNRRRTRHAR